jgi:hypothetical protein
LAVCLLLLAGARLDAAEIPNFPKARALPADGLPASCLEWTDGCRVCAHAPDGAIACSNVGIACQPQKPRCTRS